MTWLISKEEEEEEKYIKADQITDISHLLLLKFTKQIFH